MKLMWEGLVAVQVVRGTALGKGVSVACVMSCDETSCGKTKAE